MTNTDERIDDMREWLYKEYRDTLEFWRAMEDPMARAVLFATLGTLMKVARHLITGQDGPVPLTNADFIVFTQHLHLPTCQKMAEVPGRCNCGVEHR